MAGAWPAMAGGRRPSAGEALRPGKGAAGAGNNTASAPQAPAITRSRAGRQ